MGSVYDLEVQQRWSLPKDKVSPCREGCSGSIFLSVQYEPCEDIDAIESTRAKVRILLLSLNECDNMRGLAQV